MRAERGAERPSQPCKETRLEWTLEGVDDQARRHHQHEQVHHAPHDRFRQQARPVAGESDCHQREKDAHLLGDDCKTFQHGGGHYTKWLWYNLAMHRLLVPEGLMAQDMVTPPPDAEKWYKFDGETWTEYVPPVTVRDYDNAMEAHLRTERTERGYTTREPDSYLNSSEPRWAQDARDWVAHRDAVMEYALGLMNAVKRGEREAPPMDEFQAGLPAVEWTYAEPEAAT